MTRIIYHNLNYIHIFSYVLPFSHKTNSYLRQVAFRCFLHMKEKIKQHQSWAEGSTGRVSEAVGRDGVGFEICVKGGIFISI